MSNEKQVEQLTTYMANFIAHIAKKLPDDVIAKLTELRDKEDSPLSKTISKEAMPPMLFIMSEHRIGSMFSKRR